MYKLYISLQIEYLFPIIMWYYFTDSSKNTHNIDINAGIMSQLQFQRYVVRQMEKLTILCEQNNACTNRLLQTMMTSLNPTLKPDGLPELPLKNNNDFQILEKLLCEETNDGGQKVPSPAYTYLVRFKIIFTSTFIIKK